MKFRTVNFGACVSTALIISFSASTVFAQVSQVSDRGSLIPSDTIYWNVNGVEVDSSPYYGYLLGSTTTPNVTTTNGEDVIVSHTENLNDSDFEIYVEPSIYFRDAGFQDGDYLLSTFAYNDYKFYGGDGSDTTPVPSTFDFSQSNETICGFGTQIAPADTGDFQAVIQAFDENGAGMSLPLTIDVTGDATNLSTAFVGLSSTTAMTSVELVVSSSGDGGGSATSWYAINQVTLTYCSDLPPEPEVPTLTCDGFAAPMANYPVTAKKNRAFPLKMELFYMGVEQTDVELAAAPVVTVTYTPEGGSGPDISDDLLAVGLGSEGNQFEFTDEGIWQFNLKSKNLASGTYDVTVSSGDASEYVIDDAANCHTTFIIN